MKHLFAAIIKYLTNHIINHIPFHGLRMTWYRRVLGWQVGPEVVIFLGLYAQMLGVRSNGRKVSIGKGTVINWNCMLYTTGGIVIGEHVSIAAGTWLVTGTHDIDDPNFTDSYHPIVIGDNVSIGMRATILGGVTIGTGAVVMAGAVVTRDVAPYAVVGGVPAKVVRERELKEFSYSLISPQLFE